MRELTPLAKLLADNVQILPISVITADDRRLTPQRRRLQVS
jgi:hypothetical protein